MCGYRGHLTTSSILGVAYGSFSWWQLHVDWPIAAVAGLLTAVGGMLPDLDSDSGVPVRELSHLTATLVPLALLRRIAGIGLSPEQALLAAAGAYIFVRYILFAVFRKLTVHRGMFHSIPAMLITGLITFLAIDHPSPEARMFLAVGTMIGFLSHLILDELFSVDLNGVIPHLNKFAGTAVKFWSPSLPATVSTYLILGGLGLETYRELHSSNTSDSHIMVLAGSTQPDAPAPVLKKVIGFTEREDTSAKPKWKLFEKKPENIKLSVPGQ